jgi:hypothetical protein
MSNRNEERDELRSSSRHTRQEAQQMNSRTQNISPSRNNMDRYSFPINHLRSGIYGKTFQISSF